MIPNVQFPINPFPGLRPFEDADAQYFYGRDEAIDELLGRLEAVRAVALLGTSGSGKSSLVRAGLLPAVSAGALGHSSRIAVFTPGLDPVGNLARALDSEGIPAPFEALRASSSGVVQCVAAAKLSGPLLLVIDQFEEIFRFRREAAQSEENDFFASLLARAATSELPIRLLITIRSDFVGQLNQFYDLADVFSKGLLLIPRMSRSQLREAIERPIEAAGATIENRCVQQILNDAADAEDLLPRLQHVLNRAWECGWPEDSLRPIDLRNYERVGALEGALNLHAEQVFMALGPPERAAAERMFRCLITEQQGVVTKRLARVSEIAATAEEPEERILTISSPFVQHHLLVSTTAGNGADAYLDLAHEALFRNWDRLNAWLQIETDNRKFYSSLAYRVAAKGALLRGDELRKAVAWLRANNATWAKRYDSPAAFDEVAAFVEHSSRVGKRNARLPWIIGILLVAALVWWWLWW